VFESCAVVLLKRKDNVEVAGKMFAVAQLTVFVLVAIRVPNMKIFAVVVALLQISPRMIGLADAEVFENEKSTLETPPVDVVLKVDRQDTESAFKHPI